MKNWNIYGKPDFDENHFVFFLHFQIWKLYNTDFLRYLFLYLLFHIHKFQVYEFFVSTNFFSFLVLYLNDDNYLFKLKNIFLEELKNFCI